MGIDVPAQARPASTYADHRTPLVRNAWYVAALSHEVGRGLLARTLLDTRVVLYRKEDGTPVALHDRCPHRSFPLSKGRLDGDRVVCGYHGMEYDAAGKCVLVPSLQAAAPNAKVASFPIVERGPLMWIWMGDAEKADEAAIPDFSWLASPDWTTVSGGFHMRTNYVAMHENLLDQTHFSFLHAGSVGTPEWATSPLEVSENNGRVELRRELMRNLPPGIYAVPMKLEGRLVDRLSEAAFVGPCGHVAFAKITNCEPRAGELDEYRVNIVHVFTPETQDTLHYWWFNSRDFGHDDAGASKFLLDASTSAYMEDVDALGWLTDVLASEPGEFKELSFRADRPGLMMRQILNRMAAAEAV